MQYTRRQVFVALGSSAAGLRYCMNSAALNFEPKAKG